MMSKYEIFSSINEYYAAGLFELEDAGVITRYANGLKRFWENTALTPYNGGALYPCC